MARSPRLEDSSDPSFPSTQESAPAEESAPVEDAPAPAEEAPAAEEPAPAEAAPEPEPEPAPAAPAPAAPAPKAKGVPVRQYLDETVVPVLRKGLRELVKQRPEDPFEFLGDFIKKNKPR